MSNKLTPIPPAQTLEPEPVTRKYSRVICCIGARRFAFDFTSTVTELHPQPAEVISIAEKRKASKRKIRRSAGSR